MDVSRVFVFVIMSSILILNSSVLVCHGGKTSSFSRRNDISVDMPLDSDVFRIPPGYNAPQQVHITQGNHDGNGVIISWTTPDEPGSNEVLYWAEGSTEKQSAEGIVLTYNYFNYTSGYIHHCTITDLEFDTKYYYEVGVGNTTRQFWFSTPPKPGLDVAYTFGLIGDLGQTYDSNRTLTHYQLNPAKGKTILYVGDLSYADDYPFHDNNRWDTWGRFTERSVAYQPCIWTAGNHEIDFAPDLGESIPFKPYVHRYPTPFEAYDTLLVFHQAGIRLHHCHGFVFIFRYVKHYMEGETMRVMYESYFVEYKVDVVFAGHVHAYERSERISNIAYNITNSKCTPTSDQSAPIYITIGDGGNQEGLATELTEPQPSYSAFREASFGHGIFDIKNRTHAYFSWHRNQDGYSVEADSVWLRNRCWGVGEQSFVASM